MKKFLAIILITFLYSSLSAQSYWTPKQEHEIDSIWLAIENLGTTSLPPLSLGRMWIGDVTGFPSSRATSGDATIDYLGGISIGTGRVTNAMLAGSIEATKLGTGIISNTELSYLDGVSRNLQSQINDITVGTGYFLLLGSTKQTSTSELYFSSGGVRYVSSATTFSVTTMKVGMPAYTSNPTLTNLYVGDYYYLGGQTDTDGSGLPLHTFKLVGLDADYNRVLLTFWDAVKTQRAIDAIVTYDEAPDSNNATAYLDFSNKNLINAWFGADVPQTVEVINYEPRMVSCFVQSLEGVTFDFNGKTVEYADRIGLPDFTDQKTYLVTMIYAKNKVYVSYVEYGTAL